MELFSLVGVGVVVLLAGMLFLSLVGLSAVVLFWRTRRILVPKMTLLLVTGLEVPIKKLARFVRVDGAFIDRMVAHMRNLLNRGAYSLVPYSMRAVFMPQCLRHPDCPARLSVWGIQCVSCGRCGLGELKKEAEASGIGFYIAPGASLIKRIVAEHRPAAVLGVGCSMEVKEGTALMDAAGIPSQAVSLARDGCVDTRVDVRRVVDAMFLCDDLEGRHVVSDERVLEIADRWSERELVDEADKTTARHRYYDTEKEVIDLRDFPEE